MPDPDDAPSRLSAFALAKRLISGMVALAKLEIQHGRQEIGAMLTKAGGGIVMIGIAVALVFAALMALIVALALLGLAAFLVWRGIRRIRKVGAPEETIASVREEVAWAKRLIRRG